LSDSDSLDSLDSLDDSSVGTELVPVEVKSRVATRTMEEA